MLVPETPITELPANASQAEVIAKINEIVKAINTMWNPEDGTRE